MFHRKHLKALVVLGGVSSALAALGQDAGRGTLIMGLNDVAAIKQKADSGDAVAQVSLGDALASRFHATEALQWYRKAAVQGNVEGEYHVGQMLLFGAPGIPNDLAVQSNPAEGIRWTFMAATNFHPYACWNMGKALRSGLGTGTNLIESYAWLKLFSETTPGSVVGRVEMNELALKLSKADLQRAQNLFVQFKSGSWHAPIARTIPDGDSRLKLNGITFGGAVPLAVINGKTLGEGDIAKIPVKPITLKIRCLKIEKESVLIEVEGEDQPRRLSLK